MRLVLENVLLFLLPTVMYCAIRYLRAEGGQTAGRILNDAPLIRLFVAGAVLVGVTRAYYATVSPGGTPSQQYIPPRMGKDGTIEPGQMK